MKRVTPARQSPYIPSPHTKSEARSACCCAWKNQRPGAPLSSCSSAPPRRHYHSPSSPFSKCDMGRCPGLEVPVVKFPLPFALCRCTSGAATLSTTSLGRKEADRHGGLNASTTASGLCANRSTRALPPEIKQDQRNVNIYVDRFELPTSRARQTSTDEKLANSMHV